MADKSTLSDLDKERLWTIVWSAKEVEKDDVSIYDCVNMAEDIINLAHDILNFKPAGEHIDRIAPLEEWETEEEETKLEARKPVENLSKFKVAIAIGHNKNTGARAHDGSDEWTTRKEVAEYLQDFLFVYGIKSQIFIRNGSLSYGAAMREHGRKIDEYGADVALELHFNASINKSATGTEMLVMSGGGARVAESIIESWKEHYPDMVLRRDEGIYRIDSSKNGYGFLAAPEAPAVVVEPCFSSNPDDWSKFKGQPKKEATALGWGLVRYFEGLV